MSALHRHSYLLVVVASACRRSPAPTTTALSGPATVSREQLCITSGSIERGAAPWRVKTAAMRAVVAGTTARDTIELRFRYVGATPDTQPLASGEIRRQVGVKLRARDTCNVVYAMWWLESSGEVRVSVKHNEGMSRHEQCGDRGYVNVRPSFARPLPVVEPGALHTMTAEIRGRELVVTVDGARAWQGTLPAEALSLEGPSGIRSDNAELELEVLAPPSAASAHPNCP